MTMAETTPTTTARPRRSVTTDLALIAGFAALISACAYIGAIPTGGAGVPITLQTFGVMLAGCVLGPVRGFLAVSLYLLLGMIGLPVFAEHSSALAGFLVKYVAGEHRTRAIWVFFCSLAGSVFVIHPLGILGMKLYFDVTWHEAFTYDTPFWIGDILKTTLVALVAAEVHRAFPQLLARR